MSVFTSLGFMIISMLIIVSMKLTTGIFALFYHYASGKYSAKKVSDLSIFFIFGAETLPVIIFAILNFFLCILAYTNLDFINNFFLWPTIGLLLALSFSFFFFYFRRGYGTKTFISRKTAAGITEKAKNVKSRSDAYILGFTAGLPELIFTFPLYLIILILISKSFITTSSVSFILLLFVLLIIAPLFLLYAYFRNGNNLADFEKLRIKNKTFFRFFVSILYLFLAFIIFIFKVVS